MVNMRKRSPGVKPFFRSTSFMEFPFGSGTSPRLITLDVTSAIEQNLLRFLPENDMPARLEKADLIDHQIKAPASSEDGGLDSAERIAHSPQCWR